MIDSLNYNMVPADFAHCLNSGCKQADSCLRHQVVRHIAGNRRDIRILNPNRAPQDGACPEFMSDKPVRYAYGWTPMFDRMAHAKAIAIKKELLGYYGKVEFYRLKRKEKKFTPQAQQYVRKVFLRHGVTEEPCYEEYRMEYKWWAD